MMTSENQANLTTAERAAIPLISRAGLNILRMHSLRIVAEHDIGTIQAAYQRLIDHTARLVSQLGGIAQEYAHIRLAQERYTRSSAWVESACGVATLALPCGWHLETRATPDGVTAILMHESTPQAEATGPDALAALHALHTLLDERTRS